MSTNYRKGPSSNENYNQTPSQHVHPEVMPSSQTLAGERRPGDPVHPMDVDPSRNRGRSLRIAAAAMVGSVVIAGGSWLALRGDNEEIKQLGTPLGGSSAPETPGSVELSASQATNDQFRDPSLFTRTEQMDYAGTILNNSTKEDLESLNQTLEEFGWADYNYMNRPIAPVSPDNTPQEIWDQIAIATHKAWQMAAEGNVEEALKITAAIAEGQEYNDTVALFNNGGTPDMNVGAAIEIPNTPTIKTGQYNEVDAQGYGLSKFTKVSVFDGDTVNVIARYTQGSTPESARWVIVKTLAAN